MPTIAQYKFSKRSYDQLKTCHEDLQKIMATALRYSDVDFIITEGHRSLKRQKKLYDDGFSKIDGISRKGKHNYDPSLAIDLIVYVRGKKKLAYNANHLAFLGGVITTVAKFLYESDEVTHLVRWGANFDKDGEIISDQRFVDMPHFELYIP